MTLKKIFIATKNLGKIKEYTNIFNMRGFKVISLLDLDSKMVPEIIENGSTFLENAIIKAKTLENLLNMCVLADDSGLCVDVLNGEPGIYTARYGKDHDYISGRNKLLTKLSDIPLTKRGAHFHTSIVVTAPKKNILVAEGESKGFILDHEEGLNGFGYDPLFYSLDLKKTFAQATLKEKNSVSHRGRAVRKLLKNFNKWYYDI